MFSQVCVGVGESLRQTGWPKPLSLSDGVTSPCPFDRLTLPPSVQGGICPLSLLLPDRVTQPPFHTGWHMPPFPPPSRQGDPTPSLPFPSPPPKKKFGQSDIQTFNPRKYFLLKVKRIMTNSWLSPYKAQAQRRRWKTGTKHDTVTAPVPQGREDTPKCRVLVSNLMSSSRATETADFLQLVDKPRTIFVKHQLYMSWTQERQFRKKRKTNYSKRSWLFRKKYRFFPFAYGGDKT